MTTPTPPKQPTDWLALFKQWVAGRTELTMKEYAESFADIFNLTPQEKKNLIEQVKTLEPKPPEPKPPKTPEKPKPKEPTVPKGLIVARTPYPKWWKDAKAGPIIIDGAGTHIIIGTTPGYRTYISTIVLSVDGETTITFLLGTFGLSGPMFFGGDGQPMGMVIAMGDSPIPLGMGGFQIITDGAGVQVGGFVSYYYEKESIT